MKEKIVYALFYLRDGDGYKFTYITRLDNSDKMNTMPERIGYVSFCLGHAVTPVDSEGRERHDADQMVWTIVPFNVEVKCDKFPIFK